MTQLSKAELANASHETWVEWLFGALRAYTADVPPERRVRAFAPLHVAPDATSPAGEIVRELERLEPPPMAAAAKAAVEVVRAWSPTLDPHHGGELALQLATRLGSRNLFDATRTLLAKSNSLPPAARQTLAFLAAKAAEARFRRSEVEQLAQLLWRMELLTPELLGNMTLLIARDDFNGLEGLPGTLLSLAPGIMQPPHDGKYASTIATRIREEYTIEEATAALAQRREDSDDEAKVREILAQLVIPWTQFQLVRVGENADDVAKSVANALMNRRMARLQQLGDQIEPATVTRLHDRRSDT